MAISKERTVYISVLSVGLAALAGDRLISSGPATASAADQSALQAPGYAPHTAPQPSAPAGFPQRLRAKAGELPQEYGADAFLIPAAWLPRKEPAAVAAAAEAEQTAEQAKEQPLPFSLTSVYAASDRGASGRGSVSAVINGTLLEKGCAFDLRAGRAVRSLAGMTGPYVLEEIDADHAEVRIVSDNSLVQVVLKTETLGNARIETRARQHQPAKPSR